MIFLPSFYMLISQSTDTTNYNAWDEDIAMVKVNQQYFFLSIDIWSQPPSDFLWKGINVWVQKVSLNGSLFILDHIRLSSLTSDHIRFSPLTFDHIRYPSFTFYHIDHIRYASLTWVGYFSQMGGLFGLCLGFRLVQCSLQHITPSMSQPAFGSWTYLLVCHCFVQKGSC